MKHPNKNKILIEKINDLAIQDQKLRRQAETKNDWELVQRADLRHTKILKKIIVKYGWPTTDMVGKKASRNAWLIVQHSDHDLQFQKKCLRLMKLEFSKDSDSIFKIGIAYLTDRILVNSGKKQLFGTQFQKDNSGILTLRPITNKKAVNKRRQDYGMETLEKYIQRASQGE